MKFASVYFFAGFLGEIRVKIENNREMLGFTLRKSGASFF